MTLLTTATILLSQPGMMHARPRSVRPSAILATRPGRTAESLPSHPLAPMRRAESPLVGMPPGQSTLTRIPERWISSRSASVKLSTNALDAA